MNKRILDLLSGCTSLLTILAALPYEKDLMQILPVEWTPYVIKAGLVSTLLLRVAAFFAPPTPSPLPTEK